VNARTLALCLFAGAVVISRADDSGVWNERQEREVDKAALQLADKAIKKLEALQEKYKDTDSELKVLLRLVDVEEEAAQYEFRIAHGEAKGQVNLDRYNDRLRSVVISTSRIIQKKESGFDDLPKIHYVRAHAYEELKETALAEKEYNFTADHFSPSSWTIQANMALSDFASSRQDQKLSILYLKRIEEEKNDSHYPIALYRLAWAYFNLGEIATATDYLVKNINYFQNRKQALEKTPGEKFSASDESLLEHSLRDFAAFYFDGFDKGIKNFTVDNALKAFQSQHPEGYLGKMMLVFAELLNSKNNATALEAWKRQAMTDEIDLPETLDIAIVNYDSLLQKGALDKILESSDDFSQLDVKTAHRMRKYDSAPKAQELLLKAAAIFQKACLAEKSPEKAKQLNQGLVTIYGAFAQIVDDSDERLIEAHYNLAEIFFSLREYSSATTQYRWVISHLQKNQRLSLSDVRLKSLSSQYQDLKARKLLAEDLKLTKIDPHSSLNWKVFDSDVALWVHEIDQYIGDYGRKTSSISDFEYEGDQLIYSKGQVRPAIDRMVDLIKDVPKKEASFAAAKLVIDTLLTSELWKEAVETSQAFLKLPDLGDSTFRSKLNHLPAYQAYKNISDKFQAANYPEVIKLADAFLLHYAQSENLSECLTLASRAATALKQPEKALYFSSIAIKNSSDPTERSAALATRALLEEGSYDFDGAARDYSELLSLSGQTKAPLAETANRFFLVNWLSKKPRALRCDEWKNDKETLSHCRHYEALGWLSKGGTLSLNEIADKVSSGSKEDGALWAAVALKEPGDLDVRELLESMDTFAAGWSTEDSLVQFTLLPSLDQMLEAFKRARTLLPKTAPLKVESRAIKRRVQLIQALESTAGKALNLPWVRVKIGVLFTTSNAYFDFCDELKKLAPPKDISPENLADYKKQILDVLTPFQEKGATLQSQALKLASESPVENSLIGKSSPKRKPAMLLKPFDATLVDALVPKTIAPDSELALRKTWEEALATKHWPRVSFFSREYRNKYKANEGVLTAMRAVSLNAAGAQPEAILELESLKSMVPPPQTKMVNEILYGSYFASSMPQKAAEIAQGLAQEVGKH
jgi:hypothetical protein